MSDHTNQVVLNIQFKLKPGTKEVFKEALYTVIEVMSNEPTFVNAVVSEDVDYPNIINLYELWNHTKESWLAEEAPKPYRKVYDDKVEDLLEEKNLSWLKPVREWGSNLTNT